MITEIKRKMTVKDLISQLEQLDQNTEIKFRGLNNPHDEGDLIVYESNKAYVISIFSQPKTNKNEND